MRNYYFQGSFEAVHENLLDFRFHIVLNSLATLDNNRSQSQNMLARCLNYHSSCTILFF